MLEKNRSARIETVVRGALAGFVATLPMTVFMVALHKLLPWWERYPLPPWQITDRLLKRAGLKEEVGEEEQQAATLVNHFGFGAAMGAIYGLLAALFSIPSVLGGLVFGLIVWMGSYLGWLPAARILPPATKHPAGRNILMIVAHLVWGSVLALLVQRLSADAGSLDRNLRRTS
jgi:hypothetical protein